MKHFPKAYLLFVLTFLWVSALWAQSGKFSGKVLDAQGNPVPYATITIFKTDSTIVNGTLTGDMGEFLLDKIDTGRYMLRVNAVGYDEMYTPTYHITPSQPDIALGEIALSGNTRMLSEVSIKAEKALMEMAVDKKVFNMDKDLQSTTGTVSDLLKNIPAVSVDVDGSVSLRGKEATILIDGKPATLLGGDVASALQSLSASSIQSVEVITNPSSKYDAQGMSGILNIITRKNQKFGINGSVTAGAGTRDKFNGSVNLNLKNQKWNIFLNSNYRSNRYYNTNQQIQADKSGNIIAGSFENNNNTHGGWFTTMGATYTINKRNTIGITQQANAMLWGRNGRTRYYQYINGSQDSFEQRYSRSRGTPLTSSTSLDYTHKFKKQGREITANVTYAHTWSKHNREYDTEYFTPTETSYKTPVWQRSPSTGTNQTLNAQADFTTPFIFPESRLDLGWKSQLYWFQTENKATIDSGLGPQPDLLLQNDYQYTQAIHAAYISMQHKLNKFSYQAGLRLEHSRYDGTASAIMGNRYSNEFLNLFPSVFVSYEVRKNQELYINYTRRTNRPSFFRLMPFVDVSNPQDTSSGNPNLKPEFIHNTELSYNIRTKQGHNFITSIYYQYTENMMDRIRRFNPETGNSFSKNENLGSGITYGLEFIGRIQILPIWDATLSANFFKSEVQTDMTISSLNFSGESWFAKLNTQIRLPEGFSVQINANYDAPKPDAQGTVDEMYWADISVRKNLFKDQLQVVANLSDIFDTRKRTMRYDLGKYEQVRQRNRETRIAQISLTWQFGRSDMKANGRKDRNSGMQQVKDRNSLRGQDGDSGGF